MSLNESRELPDDVTFEEDGERLKVAFPIERNPLYLAVYSLLLASWVGVTAWMLWLLFAADLGALSLVSVVVWIIILLVWAYIWYRLGRNLWHWWQYYMAEREMLIFQEEVLLVHRPFFLTGATDAYALEHVSPFRYDEKQRAIAFAYGARAGSFATGLPAPAARRLAAILNRRFFPDDFLD